MFDPHITVSALAFASLPISFVAWYKLKTKEMAIISAATLLASISIALNATSLHYAEDLRNYTMAELLNDVSHALALAATLLFIAAIMLVAEAPQGLKTAAYAFLGALALFVLATDFVGPLHPLAWISHLLYGAVIVALALYSALKLASPEVGDRLGAAMSVAFAVFAALLALSHLGVGGYAVLALDTLSLLVIALVQAYIALATRAL